MKEINPDIVGMSEIDSIRGDNSMAFLSLIQTMTNLGYQNQFYERKDGKSASAVFYKHDNFELHFTKQNPFNSNDSEFLMLCFLRYKEN